MCLRRFTSTSWQDVHEARDRKGQFAIAAFLPYIHPSRFSILILCADPIPDPSRNLSISPRAAASSPKTGTGLWARASLSCATLEPSHHYACTAGDRTDKRTPGASCVCSGLELTLTPSQSELRQIQGHKGALRSAMVPPLRQ